MTHDNHPTAAPLTAEQIQSIRVSHEKCGDDCNILNMADMALASLDRPVPSDMAEDVAIINVVLIIAYEDFNHHNKALGAKKALGRIVAHLSPRDAAPSGDAKDLAKKLMDNIGEGFDPSVYEYAENECQQALDQARAEQLEMAAQEVYDKNAHNYDSEMRSYAKGFAANIRALIPARQHS